jgi:hypothetical protein
VTATHEGDVSAADRVVGQGGRRAVVAVEEVANCAHPQLGRRSQPALALSGIFGGHQRADAAGIGEEEVGSAAAQRPRQSRIERFVVDQVVPGIGLRLVTRGVAL